MTTQTAEHLRLKEARENQIPWRKWGTYLSERQWGTVREDYSANGDAWNYFTHDQARSRAYRWGEDGIAGLCNEDMTLCFAIALWNGKDPILKERLFGLTNLEGNHGEDVKEYYFYLDNTPTHSYMKMLYKYPQSEFPYDELVKVNGARSRKDFEYELLDTGIFDDNRYFDVFVEYAKASPEDILIRISVINRGPDAATLHVLPHLWFRNTGWLESGEPEPSVAKHQPLDGMGVINAAHWELGHRYLYCENAKELLFTNNETNTERLFGQKNRSPYVKDGINNYILHGNKYAVNPEGLGTKAAAHYEITVPPSKLHVIRLRFSDDGSATPYRSLFGKEFDHLLSQRHQEANHFFSVLAPDSADEEARRVMRQGLSGMLWSKQTYIYEASRWLQEHEHLHGRNSQWPHLYTRDVISMPDKWEYPWFAAWDLAFHAIALAFVDPDFALQQLELMLRERYLHPSGQIPAYEWNFGDVNPPVHAWATLFGYRLSKDIMGERGLEILKSGFHKLLLNFTWWVNRKDRNGQNVFEGGYLGLDSIGIFDRSATIPGGGHLEQADGTAWMALFAQNMLEMALELSMHDPVYGDLAVKFYEHFVGIASAMCRNGSNDSMWDEKDGFYYDLLRLPDGRAARLKLRTMVGLLPLCAVTVYPADTVRRLPEFAARAAWFNRNRPDLLTNINPPGRQGVNGRYMLSILDERKLRRVLACMLNPNEFLSEYGLRSMSRYHLEHPYVVHIGNEEFSASYLPAESDNAVFGGNSNWRGPVWMPLNLLVIRALLQMYSYYGNDFTVECPTGSGNKMTLYEVAQELATRLIRIFLPDKEGRRPVFGGTKKFQTDPHWRNMILFYEYFHGDVGAGLGASHQTGWTGVVAGLMRLFGTTSAEDLLRRGGSASVVNAMTSTQPRDIRKRDDVHATTLHDPIAEPFAPNDSPAG